MTIRIGLPRRKRSIIATVVVALLVLPTAALAAWFIYAGLQGSAHGNYATTTTVNALTFADDASMTNVPISPCWTGGGTSCVGGQGKIFYTITNNDPSHPHSWTTPGVTFTTSDDGAPDNCASHLAANTADSPWPSGPIPAGGQVATYIAVASDDTTPYGCATATITATFTGAAS